MKEALYLGGGGFNGLSWMLQNKYFHSLNINNMDVYGCSAGSIVGAGALQYGQKEFKQKILDNKPDSTIDLPKFFVELLKLGQHPLPSNLKIFVWDAIKQQTEILDASYGYNLSSVCRGSSAIPFLVPPMIDIKRKKVWFDGGIPNENKNLEMLQNSDYDVIHVVAPMIVKVNGNMLYEITKKDERFHVSYPSFKAYKKIIGHRNIIQRGFHMVNPSHMEIFNVKDYRSLRLQIN